MAFFYVLYFNINPSPDQIKPAIIDARKSFVFLGTEILL